GEAPLLEGPILRLPLIGQPCDVRGREARGVFAEERRERLAEVAGREAAQVKHGQHLGDLRGATHARRGGGAPAVIPLYLADAAGELAPLAVDVDPAIVDPWGIHGDRP